MIRAERGRTGIAGVHLAARLCLHQAVEKNLHRHLAGFRSRCISCIIPGARWEDITRNTNADAHDEKVSKAEMGCKHTPNLTLAAAHLQNRDETPLPDRFAAPGYGVVLATGAGAARAEGGAVATVFSPSTLASNATINCFGMGIKASGPKCANSLTG